MTRREALQSLAAVPVAAAIAPQDPPAVRSQGRPLPKSEFDYVDWNWDRWRSITGADRPVVRTAQAGRAELVELVDPKTASPASWQGRRRGIVDALRPFLGEAPREHAPLAARVLSEERTATHVRRHVAVRSVTGEDLPVLVLLPWTRSGRTPAVLCPHQTTQAGMREPAGLEGNPEQFTARALVERGFIAATWDALGFGARHDPASGHYGDAIPFYRAHPRWSLLGKMAADASRVVDYLETLDIVDPARIGSIGHSHGGITTIFAMALDGRIAAGAANCGFDTFRIDGNVFRWSHATALLPRLGFFVSSPYIDMERYRAVPDSEVIQVPFDLHEVLALVAPRPLFVSTSDDDFVFPNAGWSARRSLHLLEPVYRTLGAGDRLASAFFAPGHRLPPDVLDRAGTWLERWLRP